MGKNSELSELLASADQINQAFEQQPHAHGQQMDMMQQATALQIQGFREHAARRQYDINRMKFEMTDVRQHRAGSSIRGSDLGDQPEERGEAIDAESARRALHTTPLPSTRMQGHDMCGAVGRNRETQDGKQSATRCDGHTPTLNRPALWASANNNPKTASVEKARNTDRRQSSSHHRPKARGGDPNAGHQAL